MCYDVSFTVSMKKLSDYFPELLKNGQLDFDFEPFDHVQGPSLFPLMPIIFTERQKQTIQAKLMEWGIIKYDLPLDTDTKSEAFVLGRNKMLNIRSEKVLDDHNSYWHVIRNRRCLIPVTGVYEHREIKGRPRKVPYFIKPRNQEIFFLPGLYSVFQNLWTQAHMTTNANEVMGNIHNSGEHKKRMPLFLPFQMAKEFIDLNLSEKRYREILGYQIPSEDLEYHPVYPVRGTSFRPDGKAKTEYFNYGNMPELGRMNPDEDNDVKTLFD